MRKNPDGVPWGLTEASVQRPGVVTGKIALAHLNEFPDYFMRLDRMEEEAKRDHAKGGWRSSSGE